MFDWFRRLLCGCDKIVDIKVNADTAALEVAKKEATGLLDILEKINAEIEKVEARSPKVDILGDGVG